MTQQQIVVGVIALVVVLGGGAWLLMNSDEAKDDTGTPNGGDVVEDDTQTRRIETKHFFDDGTHTLVGEVVMPTPCDLLEVSADVAESDPEQVTVRFEVINNSEGGVCAQVLTPQRFSVSFDASADANIRGTYEGEEAILNIIEAEEGETPEDFELFLKG